MSTTFAYDSDYLSAPDGYDLEPALPRRAGQHYIDGLPGCFTDCAPDRWGRNLIDKRRRAEQHRAGRRQPAVTDLDYLLGVCDLTRQGNLRFARDDGPFLAPDDGVPPLLALPKLLASADRLGATAGDGDLDAVKTLLDAGSASLGGARPKASVRDDHDTLLLAKFPHGDDVWDVMAWEKTMLDVADSAGLRVPRRRLTAVGQRNVLLLHRFDRESPARRVGYISAMTLLGARDGDERDYDDIAQQLTESGAAVKDDLAELFARVVLNVAVHNTDDHLRNHGFIRAAAGWRLSPLFDVNPNPDLRRRRATGVMGAVDAPDEIEALPGLAESCHLTADESADIVRRVVTAAGRWRAVAARNGITPREADLFEDAMTDRLDALAPLAGG